MFLTGTILPLFALVAAGWVLGRWRRLDAAPLVDVCLYLLMPVLMFSSLVRDPLTADEAARYVAWYAGYVAVAWGVGASLGRLAGWGRPAASAASLSLMGINVGSYGVPVVLYAVGESALSAGMLLFACSNATAGSVGVYVAAAGRARPLQALASVFRLPLIYAVGAALLCTLSGVSLPARVLDTAHAIGMAGPTVALVVLGLQLARLDWRAAAAGQLVPTVTVKLLLGPALGIVLARLLAVDEQMLLILALMACLPTAINALLLAVRYDARPDLVGAVCMVTTLLSPLSMLAVLAWLRPI